MALKALMALMAQKALKTLKALKVLKASKGSKFSKDMLLTPKNNKTVNYQSTLYMPLLRCFSIN